MELYTVPQGSNIRVLEDEIGPPGAPAIKAGEILNFRNLDGMYSYCTRPNGEAVYLKAWAQVEIVK